MAKKFSKEVERNIRLTGGQGIVHELFPRFPKWIKRLLSRFVSFLIGEWKLICMYCEHTFEQGAKNILTMNKITVLGQKEVQQFIPQKGGFILVMNHPLGLADAILAWYTPWLIRHDTRVLTNKFMSGWPYGEQAGLWVNNNAEKTSKQQVRILYDHMKKGNGTVIMPAGKVARGSYEQPVEPPWDPSFIRLAKKYKVPIIPVHFEGRNSRRFYFLNRISESLAALTILRECMRFKNKTVTMTAGAPFYVDPSDDRTDQQKADEVRKLVLDLGLGKEKRSPWMKEVDNHGAV